MEFGKCFRDAFDFFTIEMRERVARDLNTNNPGLIRNALIREWDGYNKQQKAPFVSLAKLDEKRWYRKVDLVESTKFIKQCEAFERRNAKQRSEAYIHLYNDTFRR